jgi:hypothetical protein
MSQLLWKALFGLLAFDLFGLGRDFARLHRTVTNWPVAKRMAPPEIVDRACDALNYACAWYPKHALCLQRAVVTTCLLRSYGVPAQMVLGAQKLPFKAHAWVEVDGWAINERSQIHETYSVCDRC